MKTKGERQTRVICVGWVLPEIILHFIRNFPQPWRDRRFSRCQVLHHLHALRLQDAVALTGVDLGCPLAPQQLCGLPAYDIAER